LRDSTHTVHMVHFVRQPLIQLSQQLDGCAMIRFCSMIVTIMATSWKLQVISVVHLVLWSPV